MINVGVIGAGFAGQIHAQAYHKDRNARVAVIVDKMEKKAEILAGEVGARAETDETIIFDDPEISMVSVAVPTPLHPELSIRALEAGKHVVVEKPLALTLGEADLMLAAAERSGKLLMPAHVLRFWPEYVAIQEVIESERLGKPMLATGYRLSNPPQWATWFRDEKASGGVILDLEIHNLDMMNWLFGRPKKVQSKLVEEEGGGWGYVITQVDYESVIATDEASFLMPRDYPFTAGLRILCEGGVVEYHFRAGGASFETGVPEHYLIVHEPGKPSQPLEFDNDDAFERQIAYFVNCVQTNQQPRIVTPADARLAVQTCLAARESLRTGIPVVMSNI